MSSFNLLDRFFIFHSINYDLLIFSFISTTSSLGTNLYGAAMMSKLPVGDFQMLSDLEVTEFDVLLTGIFLVFCEITFSNNILKLQHFFSLEILKCCFLLVEML